MNLDVNTKYEVVWYNKKVTYETIADLVRNYNKLHAFGMHHSKIRTNSREWHYNTRHYYHPTFTKDGILYRYLTNNDMYRFGYSVDAHESYAVVYDGFGNPIDPKLMLGVYFDAFGDDLKYRNINPRNHGARRAVYAYRHRKWFGAYRMNNVDDYKLSLDFINSFDYDIDSDYESDLRSCVDKITHMINYKDTKASLSYDTTEGYYDRPERSIEKSWKCQTKNPRQWKAKKEIIEMF